MREPASQLKKGVLEILVLHLLRRSDLYGYQLIQELEGRSGGFFKMKEGTLYPVLYRLEDSGHVMSYWEEDSGKRGVRRKYYRITDSGKQKGMELREDLSMLFSAISNVLGEDIG